MKTKNIFWGLFFIAGAGLITARAMVHLAGITLTNLVIAFFLLPILVKSLLKLNFFGILMPLAIFGILFANELHITEFVPWPILIVAFLLSIGLSLIFGSFSKWEKRFKVGKSCCSDEYEEIVDVDDEDVVKYGVSFGSSVKYLNSKSLRRADISCSFGALALYFDRAVLYKGNAVINLDINFAGAEIFIPKEWNVIIGVDTFLGGIDEKRRSDKTDPDAPTLKITGDISFAGVDIIYI